jgi:hypothetical protein
VHCIGVRLTCAACAFSDIGTTPIPHERSVITAVALPLRAIRTERNNISELWRGAFLYHGNPSPTLLAEQAKTIP